MQGENGTRFVEQFIGGHGVLNIDYLARALRLGWPWLEWKGPKKIWAGLDDPCNDLDMHLFYFLCRHNNHSGKWRKDPPVWEAPWLHGAKPSDISLLIYKIS
jgi:hypothetical protein